MAERVFDNYSYEFDLNRKGKEISEFVAEARVKAHKRHPRGVLEISPEDDKTAEKLFPEDKTTTALDSWLK